MGVVAAITLPLGVVVVVVDSGGRGGVRDDGGSGMNGRAMGLKVGDPLRLLPCRPRWMLGGSQSSSGSEKSALERGWCSRPSEYTRPSMVVTVVWEAPARAKGKAMQESQVHC